MSRGGPIAVTVPRSGRRNSLKKMFHSKHVWFVTE